MIKFLDQVIHSTPAEVGEKAFQLGCLLKEGINVPKGFVITSTVFKNYIQHHQLNEPIENILSSQKDMATKSKEISWLIDENPIPEPMVQTIEDAFVGLDCSLVAVRSSCESEDLADTSFAGQYNSYLHIDKDRLMHNVIKCWKSLFSPRSLAYSEKNRQPINYNFAVIVQELVESTHAGVLFTCNPLSGHRHQCMINVAEGFGEQLVSGDTSGDTIILSKDSMDFSLSNSTKVLSQRQLTLLHDMVSKIDSIYHEPRDLEFAFHDDELYILQSRGVTTLFPIDNLLHDGKLRGYLCASTVMLGMKEPLTPYGMDVYGGMFPIIIQVMAKLKKPLPSWFNIYNGGRIFLDITPLLTKPFFAKQFGNAFSGNDLPLGNAFNDLFKDYNKEFKRQGFSLKIPAGMFTYGFRLMKPMIKAFKTPGDAKYDGMKQLGATLYNELEAKAEKLSTVNEYIEFSQNAMVDVFILTQQQAFYAIELSFFDSLKAKLSKLCTKNFNLDILSYGLPNCITLTMNKDLVHLAKYYDEQGIQPTDDDTHLLEFLCKYGHRSAVELDVGYTRWHENPEYIIKRIKTMMKDGSYSQQIEQFRHQEDEVYKLIDNIYEDIKSHHGERKAKRIRKKIYNCRRAAGMREYPKYNIVQVLDLIRSTMLRLGEQLVDEKKLQTKEDIFFLRMTELKEGTYNQRTIDDAKDLYDKEMKRKSVPRLLLNTGEMYFGSTPVASDATVLQGHPLSSGTYKGRIKIVDNIEDASIQQGEIMVAESTNPGWTPLFNFAGALIMEYGGPLSHGGIVAREYGIPAVVGISSATTRFKDGDLVIVDGHNGTVTLVKE